MRQSIWRVARTALCAYLVIVLLLMIFEKSLIFFPFKFPQGDWQPAGLAIEDAAFTAADGTRLHGWCVVHDSPRAVILHAHGNAGNITHRTHVLRILNDRLGATVLVFDYRGYGKSEGSPDEEGILQDARAARAWLAKRAGIPESEIVLMGESIGGAVAADLASADGARALILENTPTSLPDVAAVHYPWAPVRILMRTRLDSLTKIKSYQGPLLQCHAEEDEIIPMHLGRQLFDAAPGPNKKWIKLPGALHNDPLPPWYYDQVEAFLNQLD